MSYTLGKICDVAEQIWPAAGAEPWDASGLVSGDLASPIDRVLLTVDAVATTVDEAIDAGVQLIIAHHPLLLRGVTSIAEDRYKGALLAKLIRADCALLAAHTNADVVSDGVSAVLADALGIQQARPILPAADPSIGIGRVGSLASPVALGVLARQLATLLPATATGVRVSGEYDQPVQTVALCGGAGDSLLSEPAVVDADVFITADLRHHPASEAREQAALGRGPALIDVSHWASEWLWLDVAARRLRQALPRLTVSVSDLRTDPWDFVVVQ